MNIWMPFLMWIQAVNNSFYICIISPLTISYWMSGCCICCCTGCWSCAGCRLVKMCPGSPAASTWLVTAPTKTTEQELVTAACTVRALELLLTTGCSSGTFDCDDDLARLARPVQYNTSEAVTRKIQRVRTSWSLKMYKKSASQVKIYCKEFS